MKDTKQNFLNATDTYFEKMLQVRPQIVKIVDQCNKLLDEKLSLEAENRLLCRKVSDAEETIQQLHSRIRQLMTGEGGTVLVPQRVANGAPGTPAPEGGRQGNAASLWSPRAAELQFLQMENAHGSFESLECSQQRDDEEFHPQELIIKVEHNDSFSCGASISAIEDHLVRPSDYDLNNGDIDSIVTETDELNRESSHNNSEAQQDGYAPFEVLRFEDLPTCRITGTSSLAKTTVMDNTEAYAEPAQGNVLTSGNKDLKNNLFPATTPQRPKRKKNRKKKELVSPKKRKYVKSTPNDITNCLSKMEARDAVRSVVMHSEDTVEAEENCTASTTTKASAAAIRAKKWRENIRNNNPELWQKMQDDSKRRVQQCREKHKKVKRTRVPKAKCVVPSSPSKAVASTANTTKLDVPPLKAVVVRWISEDKISKIDVKDVAEQDRRSLDLGQTISVKFGRKRYINACIVENIIFK